MELVKIRYQKELEVYNPFECKILSSEERSKSSEHVKHPVITVGRPYLALRTLMRYYGLDSYKKAYEKCVELSFDEKKPKFWRFFWQNNMLDFCIQLASENIPNSGNLEVYTMGDFTFYRFLGNRASISFFPKMRTLHLA